jgi:hypothetical protein
MLKFNNPFLVEHYRDNKLIGCYKIFNGIKTVGKNLLLDVMFHGGTAAGTWYIGLMDNSGYTAENAADTLASHAGWNEFTNYTGNRQEWVEDAASSGSITNSTASTFAILGSGTLKGIFVCSAATGTSGTLWSSASFASTVPVSNGDDINITYTVNA